MQNLAYAKRVLVKLTDARSVIDERLLSGSYHDLVEYREAIGQRRGLLAARDLVLAQLGNDELLELKGW